MPNSLVASPPPPEVLSVFNALLRRLAITDTVLVAGNGQAALDLVRTHCDPASSPICPALLLLDMKMPIMNGLEFLQASARRPAAQSPTVVLIMLTTSLDPNDKGADAGPAHCRLPHQVPHPRENQPGARGALWPSSRCK